MEAAELERVRRARGGDAEAFRGIVTAYSRPLWRAAFRVLGDSAAAEDAVRQASIVVAATDVVLVLQRDGQQIRDREQC
jgi:DNA-directed RNA polymerase specialized sigma24 family protein